MTRYPNWQNLPFDDGGHESLKKTPTLFSLEIDAALISQYKQMQTS